jgi:hypothetical protein
MATFIDPQPTTTAVIYIVRHPAPAVVTDELTPSK